MYNRVYVDASRLQIIALDGFSLTVKFSLSGCRINLDFVRGNSWEVKALVLIECNSKQKMQTKTNSCQLKNIKNYTGGRSKTIIAYRFK